MKEIKGLLESGAVIEETIDQVPENTKILDSLTIRDVRLGWCGPGDWNPSSSGTSQSAKLKPEVVANFVSLPPVCIHGINNFAIDMADWQYIGRSP